MFDDPGIGDWWSEAKQRVSPRARTTRDADYDAALATVRQAIDRFVGCSPEERASLERDLDQLYEMAEKLEAGRVEIVVFGEISTGKSALINALVGDAVAQVNVRGGWTKDVWHLKWRRRRLLRAGAREFRSGADRHAGSERSRRGGTGGDGARSGAAGRHRAVRHRLRSERSRVLGDCRARGQPQADRAGAQQGRSLLAGGAGRTAGAVPWPAARRHR